ncbi:MAG: MATE family efflux transporter [Rhizobiales bacterium TMED94]|nr:MATE family multidrug exporter [Rhodobiaceae bacterium]RPF86519.1 MAG: MATE family efflux transporter [Rhizobiales bacterium TMED94]
MKKFIKESNHFFKIGIPIFGSQLSYMIMHTTDTIVSGRYSSEELAGLVLAGAFTFPLYMLFQGIMFAITPIVAQLYGSKEFTKIGQKMRQIFWIAILIAFSIFFIFLFLSKILLFFPLDKNILSISAEYLKAVSVGMFFYVMFRYLSSYSEGMTLTLPVFFVVLIGALINIPLDIIFAFGYFGIPEMGSEGCGYATSIVSMIMFFSMLRIILSSEKYKKTELLREFNSPSLKVSKEILKLGVPIGVGIFAEMTMFSGAAIIIGQLGDKILSGHAVALNIASILFMLPLAIGLAGSTRVGNLLGEKRFLDAKYSSYVGVSLCFIGALFNMIILLIFRENFSSIYSKDIEVINVAISLLFYASIFQIPDGIQMGSLGALRGYKDTFAPMVFLLISYWIFAIPLGYFLTNYGFAKPLGAEGMWISMIMGLILFSVFIFNRLRLVSSKYI